VKKEELRDAYWLLQHRRGVPTAQIARESRRSIRAVQLGMTRARSREMPSAEAPHYSTVKALQPHLVPLFPITSFEPGSVCPHKVPMESLDTDLYCMCCDKSGRDDHPALQRDPRTDPKPDPKPPAPEPEKLTRRQKRAKKFGRAS